MLRCLCALIGLAVSSGAPVINGSSVLNISSMPITYYGKKYEQVYVSFTNDHTTFCFDGYYDPPTRQDCLVAAPAAVTLFAYEFIQANPTSTVLQAIPSITSAFVGKVVISVKLDTFHRFEFLNCGTEAGLFLDGPVGLVDLLVNGITVDTLKVNSTEGAVFDISGCRHSGFVYKRGQVFADRDSCSFCNDSAVVVITRKCGDMERCQGNGICMLDTSCTVTGPNIIDVNNNVHIVKDRCAYSLLSTPSVPGFHVLANFRERRRKDVSFLDSVTLRLGGSGVDIHLEQGGRVRLDDTVLSLDSLAQTFHGVELSKDPTGVTATRSVSNHTISVFFDGNTAQIIFKGDGAAVVASLDGLCGNSGMSLSDALLEESASGCAVLHSGAADSTINCSMATECCNLLKEVPFTVCHNLIGPEPYIKTCIETLCRYPAVDALNCQFLEAYAGACSLNSSTYRTDALEGWRSQAGCSPPQAFCQDRICGGHEFCAEKTDGGEIGCFCRAIFASPYTSAGTLGDPTVCGPNSASVSLLGCLLEEEGIDYSSLRLKDQTCTGHMDKLTGKVTFRFDSSNSCGTEVTANNSQIIYKNTIATQNSSSDVIISREQVYIDFSCVYTQPEIKSEAFTVLDSSLIQHVMSGSWNYTLSMKAYTDAGRTRAVRLGTHVKLDQKIWVELKTDGLEGSLVAVVTDSCWATSEASPGANPRYDLITNGCGNPNDKTLKVEGNGLGTSNHFSFNMFRFSRTSGDVYLHCKVKLCPKLNQDCSPSCSGGVRGRRSSRPKYEDEATAFITMAWTN
ncbi:uncharacterized protein LOC141760657 [Sebastes fasciatus]|uniref:uncharacterized protein LOC141760657 n=1 Tax=Sebastes fasciatus TaxID=394691 RepID=UPI003D9DC4BC